MQTIMMIATAAAIILWLTSETVQEQHARIERYCVAAINHVGNKIIILDDADLRTFEILSARLLSEGVIPVEC